MEKTFVISDTWFNRPCEGHYGENHMEYNRNIILKWNSVVSENDTVYVLGGFGICDLYDIVFELNGKIVFLNMFLSEDEIESRDRLAEYVKRNSGSGGISEKLFFSEKQFEMLPDKDVILSYFPLAEWYGKKTGSMCFHGMHKTTDINNGNICCNASEWDFKPVDIDEVKNNISKFRSMV